MEPKYFETRIRMHHPAKPGEVVIYVKAYQARSKYEAIGKAVGKTLPSWPGYCITSATAIFTRQQPPL